jgi:hypothetical protein
MRQRARPHRGEGGRRCRAARRAPAGENRQVRTPLVSLLAGAAAVTLTVSVTDAVARPIPQGPALAPAFLGVPAVPAPVPGVPPVPQNPYLAPNGDSGIHDDGWQTNTYDRPGPLGVAPRTISNSLIADCASIAFDSAGRVVATCIGLATAALYLMDPHTLAVLGKYRLPGRSISSVIDNPNIFQGFGGGGYFYLDNLDRAVIGTNNGHILVLAENATASGFTLVHDYNLNGVLLNGETLNSALPDSTGLLWFVAKQDGVVGTLNLETGATHVRRLGSGSDGEIENSFAVGMAGDVYIATNHALYRFDAGANGRPDITWQVTYANTGKRKPGQVDAGTGTTPAILPGGYVAITDNADPMDVVVYRTDPAAAQRQVCAIPVFAKGASATENSLIAAGPSLVVENNYGYTSPASTSLGGHTKPGFARVDIDADGGGCRLVWTNTTVAAPTVVPKLSLATGLVYAYTKTRAVTDPWYWTAIDFRTGQVVWRSLAGAGIGFNNNYAGLTLGPDGTAYLGTLGGIIAMRDT